MVAFTSKFLSKEHVIDDNNYMQHVGDWLDDGKLHERGRIPRDWSKEPFGAVPHTTSFDFDLIPRSEWTGMIEQMEKDKSRLSDIIIQSGIKSKDQNGTNYCWFNANVTAYEAWRAANGMPYINFSPASGAAPIKGFRNSGGWGGEGNEWLVEKGIVPVEYWPANAISRQYYTEDNKKLALNYRVAEFTDVQSRNFNQLATLLLLRIPVCIGLNWWSHEVCAIDLVATGNNQFGVRFRNSWGDSYGDHGFSILTESKATPDDAVAPRVVFPSEAPNTPLSVSV